MRHQTVPALVTRATNRFRRRVLARGLRGFCDQSAKSGGAVRRHAAVLPLLHRSTKLLSKPRELLYTPVEVCKVPFCYSKDSSAGCAAGSCDLQDLADIIKGEAQALCLANESKFLEPLGTIPAISARAPVSARQDAQALVVPDGLRPHAGSTRELADQHRHPTSVHPLADLKVQAILLGGRLTLQPTAGCMLLNEPSSRRCK